MPAHRFERGVDPELPRIAIETRDAPARRDRRRHAGSGDRSRAAASICRSRNRSRCAARGWRACSASRSPMREVERILRALGLAVEATRGRLAASTRADAALRHRDRGRPDRGSRAHPRLRRDPDHACPAARRGWPRRAKRGSPSTTCAASSPRAITWKRSTTPSSMPACSTTWQLRTRRGRRWPIRSAPNWASCARAAARAGRCARAQRRAPAGARAPVRTRQGLRGGQPGQAPVETLRIAAVAMRRRRRRAMGRTRAAPVDFHDLKGDLDSAGRAVGRARSTTARREPPGRIRAARRTCSAATRRIGWIGQLHPRLQQALDLDHAVIAFELDLAPLRQRALPHARRACRSFRPSAGTSRSSSPRGALGGGCRHRPRRRGRVACATCGCSTATPARGSNPVSRVSLWA